MSSSPQDFLTTAEELADGTDESRWRTSASRAYYSMYHQALALANVHLEDVQGAMGDHQRLAKRFTQAGGRLKVLGHVLATRKRVRTTADYEISVEFSASMGRAQISAANEFFAALDRAAAEIPLRR